MKGRLLEPRREVKPPRRYTYLYSCYIDSTHAIKPGNLMVCVGSTIRDITDRRHGTRHLELVRIKRKAAK